MPRPIPDNVPLRTVHSFVIRRGRMTEAQQAARDRAWTRFGLEVTNGELNVEQVFGRKAPLVVEIGFGMGTSLVAMAKAAPDKNFIGIEVHPPGIGNLLKLIEQEQLTNVRVYQADAKVVLEQCIANGSLDCVQIFFPDPWHKKRHHKRRLIQKEFVEELKPKLANGGVLHLATDWEPYALQMMDVLSAFADLHNRCGAGQYCADHQRPLTKFEQRGQKLGHGVWDLMFELKS
jgi:tRNA (guanine-N7-)-methyltransferase